MEICIACTNAHRYILAGIQPLHVSFSNPDFSSPGNRYLMYQVGIYQVLRTQTAKGSFFPALLELAMTKKRN
jgi:hypothetical protein